MENNDFISNLDESQFQNNPVTTETYNEVYVWGEDKQGQLGLCGQFEEDFIVTPKACSFNVVIKSLACGFSHTLFVSDGGHCYAMGSNQFGQLGQGDKAIQSKNLPCLVEAIEEHVIT